jgi:hypothetical protein
MHPRPGTRIRHLLVFLAVVGPFATVLPRPARGEPGRPAACPHLDWAMRLVEEVRREDTSYRHRNSAVHWRGVGGAEMSDSHTDCSGLVNALLRRSYGLTGRSFQQWLGTRRPQAITYHDAIVAGDRFTRIRRLADVRPGDIIAIRYDLDDPDNVARNTGHILLVVEKPRMRAASAPRVAGTTQWEVVVIDQSSSGHGASDTRRKPGGGFASGLGKGVLRVYTDRAGNVAGYTWSTSRRSRYYDQDERHLVLGRLDAQRLPGR